jgi:hypothetical protein
MPASFHDIHSRVLENSGQNTAVSLLGLKIVFFISSSVRPMADIHILSAKFCVD